MTKLASTVTPILPALEVDSAAELTWSDSAEVLVVGWGGAGASAAIEARSVGASTLVIDRFSGGGATALSGGVVYAGGGTDQQNQAGCSDSPAAMFDYLQHEVEGVVSDATLQSFCDQSVANLHWLEAQGVSFGASLAKQKTSYPPDGVFLYYSGNEVVPAFAGVHAPAPRGHRAVSKGQSGAALFAGLQAATLKSGARIMTQACVRRLVRQRSVDDQPGRILGVEVWQLPAGDPRTARHVELDGLIAGWRLYHPGKAAAARSEQAVIEQQIATPSFVRANRAVILSTGGYIYNPELINTHAPQYRKGWPIGGSGCDGSGLRLGQSVGAAARKLGNISGWRFITPPYSWPKGLVINRSGERFCNEQVYGAKLGHHMVEQQGGKAWLLIDSKLRWQAIKECLFGRLWAFQSLPALALMFIGAKKASTVAELALRIGADPETLNHSVEAANAAARGEAQDPMGKSADMRQQLIKAPFYAIDISIGEKLFPLATLTLGGLTVNEIDGHVTDSQGRDIPGLFSAGRSAIGLPSSSYISGLSLADCVFSGRRAGRAAVNE